MTLAEVYIHYKAIRKAFIHAEIGYPKEVLGLLVGDRFKWNNTLYTEVVDYVPIRRTESTRTKVMPKGDEMARAYQYTVKKYKNMLIVGWAHSHPGYGCFLSDIDIDTQRRYFNQPYHIAMVVDPVRYEIGIFKLKGTNIIRPSFKVIRRVPFYARRRAKSQN